MVFSICKCKFMVFGFHHYARSLKKSVRCIRVRFPLMHAAVRCVPQSLMPRLCRSLKRKPEFNLPWSSRFCGAFLEFGGHVSHHKICNLRYGTHGYGMSAYKWRCRLNAVILNALRFANDKGHTSRSFIFGFCRS